MFMDHVSTNLAGFEVQICRCGYTGEDGFEISVESSEVEALTDLLL
jgi:aminomethyltransferase